jgi:hypothetical protein
MKTVFLIETETERIPLNHVYRTVFERQPDSVHVSEGYLGRHRLEFEDFRFEVGRRVPASTEIQLDNSRGSRVMIMIY